MRNRTINDKYSDKAEFNSSNTSPSVSGSGSNTNFKGNLNSKGENMTSPMTQTNTFVDINNDKSNLRASSLLSKAGVPISHIVAADNYMFVKKIYGTPVVKSRITNKDKALLGKYDFNQLEYTTVKQINEELELLKKWSSSLDKNLKTDADNIIDIRLKELKYLAACRYTLITNEIYNGYIALEKYFEDISKYSI